MNNEKFLEKKMRFVKGYVVFGFLLIAINLALSYSGIKIGDFWFSIINIWGVIFIAMGIVRYFLYRNQSILKFYRVHETDERSEMLRGKAGYLTFVFSSIALAICSVIFVSFDLIWPSIAVLAILFVQFILFYMLMWHYSRAL